MLAGRVEPRRFRPRLSYGYHQDLVALVKDQAGLPFTERVDRVRASIDTIETHRIQLSALGVTPDDLEPTIFYAATLRLLRDLILQGWTAGADDDGIYILPPLVGAAGDDPSESKSELRDSFKFVLADQLLSDSVASFIGNMERDDIAQAFADGPELAKRLSSLGDEDISAVLQPTLELITPDARDALTGVKLQDIWRYARLQWSIPYQQTPGRNMHYLIRDEAGPGRPIIGIAALGNAILGLSQRDNALGWSSESLERRLLTATTTERRALARHLVDFMMAERERVYDADLDLQGLRPERAIDNLADIEREADWARESDLSKAGDDRTDEYALIRDAHGMVDHGSADDVDWVAIAKTHLYRRKRAANLANTIRTLATYERANLRNEPDRLSSFLQTEDGRRAVDTTLRRIKQRAVAENVMEIITCGAVAPYNQILGGKLVAMLMTSPQVVKDVRDRYEGKVSLIASGMAGRSIAPAIEPGIRTRLYCALPGEPDGPSP